MAAETIAIVGESGTGKSTSLRNLNPEETFLISTTGEQVASIWLIAGIPLEPFKLQSSW